MNEIPILEPKKHALVSWLSSRHAEELKETKTIDKNSKPKWFEEMIKNAESVDNKTDSTKKNPSDESDDFILDLDYRKSTAKQNSSNQIYSKRRNTLNILQTENQNFLNTLSKSTKTYTDLVIDENLSEKVDRKITPIKAISNQLKDLISETHEIEFKNFAQLSTNHVLDSDKSTGEKADLLTSIDEQTEDFIIPDAPDGKLLTIVLKSNWGDENDWIGLNGIEIFDLKTFECVSSSKMKFLNNLDTSPQKLFDGNYRTHDDDHIWMCKFDNKVIELKIEFENIVKVGLIRIWNFNKSRIYSYRGVKEAAIYLDDVKIFDGQIRKANGELKGCLDKFGDMIVYTTDENNLEQIFKNDTSFQELLSIC